MKLRLLIFFFIIFAFTSCFEEEKYTNSRMGNFEALWKIMDEKYCFFDYKNVDWNEVHDKYAVRIQEDMNDNALFGVLAEMLAEVKDGHVNLTSKFDVARYWKWYEDYPDNFDQRIHRKYLGNSDEYSIASGIKYKILDDNVGYIYYGNFSSGLGASNLDHVLNRLRFCDGIIIDIRDNGGGFLTNSEKLAERFFNEKTLVGYIMHKTGKGHTDFSKPYEKYIEPPTDRIRYQKKVVVLTNRRCFSSSNDFVNAMKYAPNAVIVGDKTGGGSGLPFSSELPNGWSVRFSASPMLNAKMEQIEFGIDPDVKVDMKQEDMLNDVDTIIETARKIIKNN